MCNWVNKYILDETNFVLNVGDFEIKSLPYGSILSSSNDLAWYQFMYSKFGEEYLEELKKYLLSEKKKKLDEISKEIDEKNDKLINGLTK